MFQFIFMEGNYESRKVGRDDFDWGFVSTAYVNDGRKPYETAVKHEKYNNGLMVIVDCYDTEEDAMKGHSKWVKKMIAKKLPKKLVDCSNSEIQQFFSDFSDNAEYEYQD